MPLWKKGWGRRQWGRMTRGVSRVGIREKSAPGRGNRKGKGPEVDACDMSEEWKLGSHKNDIKNPPKCCR